MVKAQSSLVLIECLQEPLQAFTVVTEAARFCRRVDCFNVLASVSILAFWHLVVVEGLTLGSVI